MTNKKLIQIASFIVLMLVFNLIPWIGLANWAAFLMVIGLIDSIPTIRLKDNEFLYKAQDFLDHKNEFKKYLKYSFDHDKLIYISAFLLCLTIGYYVISDLFIYKQVSTDMRLAISCFGAIYGFYFFRSYIQAYKEMKQ